MDAAESPANLPQALYGHRIGHIGQLAMTGRCVLNALVTLKFHKS
jgi:hypothetical protein